MNVFPRLIKTLSMAGGVVLASLFMMGCGGEAEPIPDFKLENHIKVEEDGAIVSTLADSFSEPYYRREELLVMLNEEAHNYNELMGEGSLAAESVETEQGMVNASMRFIDRTTYASYNEAVFFVGTIAEAIDHGMQLEMLLAEPDRPDRTIDIEGLKNLRNAKIIITDEHERKAPLTIETFGQVLYVSGGIEGYVNDSAVRIGEATGELAYIVFR